MSTSTKPRSRHHSMKCFFLSFDSAARRRYFNGQSEGF